MNLKLCNWISPSKEFRQEIASTLQSEPVYYFKKKKMWNTISLMLSIILTNLVINDEGYS